MIEQWIETLRRGECIREHELKKLCSLVSACMGTWVDRPMAWI